MNKTNYINKIISGGVLLTGLVTVMSTLFASTAFYPGIVGADAVSTVLIGVTFVYLSSLLNRGKHNAWLIALPLYVYIVGRNFYHFTFDYLSSRENLPVILINLLLPVLVLAGLLARRKLFNARSELSSFISAANRAALVLAVALMYGLIGFTLMDDHDFHQEISWPASIRYTIDQLNLTGNDEITPHTKRARLFLDSLGALSLGSLGYVGVSLFAPIKFRLSTRPHERAEMEQLLRSYPANSEDFFKLWPPDKMYFFDSSRRAALAYKTIRDRALILGDPAGDSRKFSELIEDFDTFCHSNGWQPVFVHTRPSSTTTLRHIGFTVQKLGEEAVLDLNHFQKQVAPNKYFRNITNRFAKHGYRVEFLAPPHDREVIKRLRAISADWLARPGRGERGFVMGYFHQPYLQRCNLAVAVDADGIIQGFINQVPSYDELEANFDMLRHAQNAPNNLNDYLMLNFINHLKAQGYKRLNMGLAPLAGLDDNSRGGLVNSALRLVYAGGGRFYSFNGLKRFKAKYEPDWQPRFIAYRGGMTGFTATISALMRAMKLRARV